MKQLFHKFGNVNINVYDIISVWTRKSFFMIFDRDYKYTLSTLSMAIVSIKQCIRDTIFGFL